MNRLLLPESIGAIREKLTGAGSRLTPWWTHFTTLARRNPVFFSPYTVLTALVTEQPSDRALARESFMRFVDCQHEGLISLDAQSHTHVVSAPLARWAIYFDWIAESGILSEAEERRFRGFLLDFAMTFSWAQSSSRARQFDNQLFANAFGATAVGYVLGVKRGESVAARRIYRAGLDALRHLLSILPPGGYSPEGSTYHEHVVMPLTLLASLLVEETTGEPTPGLRLLLETSCRMIGPDGLMPPWDHYGYQPAAMKSGLAYLARLTRDTNPLAIARDRGLWYRTCLPAWDIDDRLWTLVFWPSDIDNGSSDASFAPWMQPAIGGAIQGKKTRVRLFQYWDETGGIPNAGRCQVDPNAIALHVNGSPILLDGSGAPKPDPVAIPEEEAARYVGGRIVESVQEYALSSWNWQMPREAALRQTLAGNVGQSNALVIDGEAWYVPKSPRRGEGEAIHHAGILQAVRSESAEYYKDRYDVTSVKRSSVMVGGRYVLVTDRVISASPHDLTWQAYVREEARLEGNRLVADTPEGVRCEIVPIQQGETTVTAITGYPKIGDERSVLFRHRVAAAADSRIDVLLALGTNFEPMADLSGGWVRSSDQAMVDLRDAYLTDTASADVPRIFRRAVQFQRVTGRQYRLRIEAGGRATRVVVNGHELAPLLKQDKGFWPGSAENLPLMFDISDALTDGQNRIELQSPFFNGESVLGPITLLGAARPTPAATIRQISPSTFEVRTAAGVDQLLSDNREGLMQWATGQTDARYAVLCADGALAALDVRRLAISSSLEFTSDAPCDFSWRSDETTLTRFVAGSTMLFSWPEHELRIQTGGCVEVWHHGSTPHRLQLTLPKPQQVFVNGNSVGVRQGNVAVPISESTVGGQTPVDLDGVFSLMRQPRAQAAAACVALLKGDDWRLQVAAADVAGSLKLQEAVPDLIACFQAGQAELPYPQLKTWWRVSKMLRDPKGITGDDPSLPQPLAVKRWRVRCATTMALGKIGDQRAVEPLEKALAQCTDFFPVTSQLALALGRLGSPTSVPVLARHENHAEINTQMHSRLSLKLLRGEITREEFERRAGMA